MSLPYFNVRNVKVKPDMWLCQPNRTTIHKIKDSFDVQINLKFSAINELSLSVPALIERNNELVQNPLIKKMKERFLIRVERDEQTEYFIILKINKQMSNDGFEYVSYQAYSIGIQIAQKLIRDYEETSKTLSYLATDILAQPVWSIDYVDVDFDLKYRSFETSSANALQCIFNLAEKFNAALVFDTVQRKVSFHHAKNIGKNKGFKFKDGFYLESFNLSIDPQSMVTRMVAFGQDGLEFRRLSPTGSNFIEDYSFFMFPFKCDANYNVIQSSAGYMSDSLCVAITKYQDKLKSLEGQFKTLTTQATTQRSDIQNREQELSVLKAKETDLMNQRDVINYTYADQAPTKSEWQTVIAQLQNTQAQIVAKENEISILNTQLDATYAQITALQATVKVENNFTQAQIEEWDEYIIVQEYYNDSITDDEELLEEAISVFEDVKQPPIELTLSLDNFMSSMEGNFNQDRKIEMGDIVMLKSRDLNIDIKAKITDITFNYESGDVSITVSNTTRANDEYSELMEKINLSANTSTTVNIDKYKWNDGREAKDSLTEYLNGALDTAQRLIQGGMKNSVTLNERGLIAIDMINKNNWLMIQNGQLFITPDNGNTVSVAINKDGVHAERLVGRLILGNKLHIEDEAGVVTIHNALMTVYDLENRVRVHLGRYPDPDNSRQYRYGLRVYDGAIDIRTHEGKRGVHFDQDGIHVYNNNGVRTFDVDSTTGKVSIAGSLVIKTHPDDNRGVVIDGNGLRIYNNSGNVVFNADNYGNVWYAGRLQNATGSIDNVDGTFKGNLVAAGGTFTGTLNGVDGVFTGSLQAVDGTFTGELQAVTGEFRGLVTGSLSTQTMKAISIDAQQIISGKITADKIQVNSLSAISANLGTITAGTINGTTINGATLNGVNINTEKTVTIGEYLVMQGRSRNTIYFGGDNSFTTIAGGYDNLFIESWGLMSFVATEFRFNGKVIDFSKL